MFDINSIEERCVLEVGKYYNLIEMRKSYLNKESGEDVPECVINKKAQDAHVDMDNNNIDIELRANAIAEHISNNEKNKKNLNEAKVALDRLIEDIEEVAQKNKEQKKKVESIFDRHEVKFTKVKHPFYIKEIEVYDKEEREFFTSASDEDCREDSRYEVEYQFDNAFPYLEDIADCFTNAHELRIEFIEDENEVENAEKVIEKKRREREEYWASKPDEPNELYWGDIL